MTDVQEHIYSFLMVPSLFFLSLDFQIRILLEKCYSLWKTITALCHGFLSSLKS
jgi:hypothetical protein